MNIADLHKQYFTYFHKNETALGTQIAGLQIVEPPPQAGSKLWKVLATSTVFIMEVKTIQKPTSVVISVDKILIENEPFDIVLGMNDILVSSRTGVRPLFVVIVDIVVLSKLLQSRCLDAVHTSP